MAVDEPAEYAGLDAVYEPEEYIGEEAVYEPALYIGQEAVNEPAEQPGQEARDESASVAGTNEELNLPMGTWLGFHDGDQPLMAKLAAHDRQKDNYIFVNRKGIKILQLSKQVLLQMIDDDLVDILQTKSTFRDAVTQAQRQSEE
jgi:hypothetical protein